MGRLETGECSQRRAESSGLREREPFAKLAVPGVCGGGNGGSWADLARRDDRNEVKGEDGRRRVSRLTRRRREWGRRGGESRAHAHGSRTGRPGWRLVRRRRRDNDYRAGKAFRAALR